MDRLKTFQARAKDHFALRADRSLFQQPVFWWAVVGPLVLSTLLATFFGLFALSFERSLDAVKVFYSEGKFFLGIAALSLPLGATVARAHSSHQTAESIRHTLEEKKDEKFKDLHSEFLNHLSLYHNKPIPVSDEHIAIDINTIISPVKACKAILPNSENPDITSIEIISSLKELVDHYENFLSTASKETTENNLLWSANKRSENFALLASQTALICYKCGVKHQKIGQLSNTVEILPTYALMPGDDPLESLKKQGLIMVEAARNLDNLSAYLYYSAQIIYSHDLDYHQLLENLSSTLLTASQTIEKLPKAGQKTALLEDHKDINKEQLDFHTIKGLIFWTKNFESTLVDTIPILHDEITREKIRANRYYPISENKIGDSKAEALPQS